MILDCTVLAISLFTCDRFDDSLIEEKIIIIYTLVAQKDETDDADEIENAIDV